MCVLTIFLIHILSSALEVRASYEFSVNVGTVLFSPNDLRRHHWTMNEVNLLKARRHFQGLLPPPNFIDTTNEDYVNTLLKYFKDAYMSIKREATSPIADSLMTTALSDALGGYLKLWVLPISKLAFYGGTVSQENIMKLYDFHKEIKRFLDTDGEGWRSPNKNLLNSITVSVAPPKHISRSMKNPCEHLSYYEKVGNGLTIPTPYVNWKHRDSTMFIPLRNQSLIPLSSPKHPNILFKYYDAAKNCIDANRDFEHSTFDNRFQTWLDKDVVPHLTDDHVYLPLGSVLSLVNRSREMCDKTLHMFEPKLKTVPTHYIIGGFPIDLTSKKFWIVTIILALEILWCIPALLYLMCVKKRQKRDSTTNIYTLLDASRNKSNTDYDEKENREKESYDKISNKKHGGVKGFKIEHRPRSGNVELDTHFLPNSKSSMGTDTYSYLGSNKCSAVSVIHEAKPTPPPLKSSMRKVRSQYTPPPPPAPVIVTKSKISIQRYERKSKKNTPDSSVHPVREGTCTDSNTVGNDSAISNKVPSSFNSDDKSQSRDISCCDVMESCRSGEMSEICPCLACLEAEVGSETTVVNMEPDVKKACSDKSVEINMAAVIPPKDTQKTYKKPKSIGLRLDSGRPYLEIMIDKPQTEISVGIRGTFDPFSAIRKSKIPKRKAGAETATTARVATGSQMPSNAHKAPCPDKNKSMIPQRIKRPTDDIVIKTSLTKQVHEKSKLNITL